MEQVLWRPDVFERSCERTGPINRHITLMCRKAFQIDIKVDQLISIELLDSKLRHQAIGKLIYLLWYSSQFQITSQRPTSYGFFYADVRNGFIGHIPEADGLWFTSYSFSTQFTDNMVAFEGSELFSFKLPFGPFRVNKNVCHRAIDLLWKSFVIEKWA